MGIEDIFSPKENRRTKCWCPNCQLDLVDSESFIEDTVDYVLYKCDKCGAMSKWDFDHPTPIIIECVIDGFELVNIDGKLVRKDRIK